MARIGIDATVVGKRGKGVARYLTNILNTWMKLESRDEYFVFYRSGINGFFTDELPNWHKIEVDFRSALLWNQIQLPLLAKKNRLDLIHSTYDAIPLWGTSPVVIYLFEIPLYRVALRQQLCRNTQWYQQLADCCNISIFPHSLQKAASIIVSSEFTKRDIIDKFHALESKVTVVYPAHEEHFRPECDPIKKSEIRKQISGGCDYLLHFSTGDPRENTPTVLQAFRKTKSKLGGDFKLVIVGRSPQEKLAQEDKWNNSILFREFATGTELVNLYQGAIAYLDPSLYEGFGFQLLEAMACGVPIVASNVTSIPEVVGDGGILLDPHDSDQFSSAIAQVLTKDSFRVALREKGLRRAQMFSWRNTAQDVSQIFQNVLEKTKVSSGP